jgi:hypothetical protein
MIDDSGDGKMQGGEMTDQTNGSGAKERGAAKPRVSPELQELMHMLSSLEHQFTRKSADE